MDWNATHRIVVNYADGRTEIIDVMEDDGAGYTREEWENEAPADWTCNDEGEWLCNGQVLPGGVNGTVTVTTRWDGWMVRTGFLGGDLLGDGDASREQCQDYADTLAEALRGTFPGADVEVRYEVAASGARPHPLRTEVLLVGREEDGVEEDHDAELVVDELAGRVWEAWLQGDPITVCASAEGDLRICCGNPRIGYYLSPQGWALGTDGAGTGEYLIDESYVPPAARQAIEEISS